MSNYRLKVDLTIVEIECFGPNGERVENPVEGGREMEMNGYQNTGLRVSESMSLGARDFMGVCKVLGDLHTAITAIGQIAEPKPYECTECGRSNIHAKDCAFVARRDAGIYRETTVHP